MKKTFTVEIEIADCWIEDGFSFSESKIKEAFQDGIGEQLPYSHESETSVKVVEQTRGTPKSVDKNALDLLKRASDSLNDYRAELDGDYNDSLASEIDKYIKDNTRGT